MCKAERVVFRLADAGGISIRIEAHVGAAVVHAGRQHEQGDHVSVTVENMETRHHGAGKEENICGRLYLLYP